MLCFLNKKSNYNYINFLSVIHTIIKYTGKGCLKNVFEKCIIV